MEDPHLSSLPTPFSASLVVSSRVCTAFQQVIPGRWKGEVLPARQGCLVATLLYAPLLSTTLPPFKNLWLGESGETETYQNIFFQDRLSNPLVTNLGSGRPMLPSLDSAFLLRRLPLFCILSPFSQRATTGGREAASYQIEASPLVLEHCLVKCYIMPCSAVWKEGNLQR